MFIRFYSINIIFYWRIVFRGGSRTAVTSKMDRSVITVNGWKPLTIITLLSQNAPSWTLQQL